MKSTIILLSLVLFCFVSIAQNTVTIYGKITNPKTKKVSIQYYKDCLTYEEITAASESMDNEGNFSMTFAWEKPKPGIFSDNNEITSMYLFPGDSLKLTLDTKEFDETVKYEGKGALVNNYLAQKLLREENLNKNNLNKEDEKKFTTAIDSLYKEDLAFLKKSFSGITTPSIIDFMNYEETEITYDRALNKLQYPAWNANLNKLEKEPELSKNYYDFFKPNHYQ